MSPGAWVTLDANGLVLSMLGRILSATSPRQRCINRPTQRLRFKPCGLVLDACRWQESTRYTRPTLLSQDDNRLVQDNFPSLLRDV
jgi:hypothetical protein